MASSRQLRALACIALRALRVGGMAAADRRAWRDGEHRRRSVFRPRAKMKGKQYRTPLITATVYGTRARARAQIGSFASIGSQTA